MKILILLSAFVLFITGCATGTYTATKAGFNQAEFRKDHYECKKDVMQSYGFGAGHNTANQFFDECLRAKGYTLTIEPAWWE